MVSSPEQPVLLPAFGCDSVAVAFAADCDFVPYLAATLRSVMDHCSPKRNYDLVVMNQDIPAADQDKITAMAGGAANISLRFVDVSDLLEKRGGDLFISAHVSVSTYFRLLSPTVFALYPKVLYLDADLLALADVAELFDIDLQGAVLGAVRDYLGIKDMPRKGNERWREQVALKDNSLYFNAGVLLLDLEQMRRDDLERQCFELLARLKRPRLHDQDLLNTICQGRVKYLNGSWNSSAWTEACGKTIFRDELPEKIYREYLESLKSPRILHYGSRCKPWDLPHLDLADQFWNFARQTPYYDSLIFACLRRLSAENDIFKARLRFPPARLKYWFYRLMSLVTFGRTRYKFRSKAYRREKMNRGLKSTLQNWH